MKFEEIEKLLQYNDNESKIFMPNEIFVDLQNNMRKSVHIPVAYSYYYLINWTYRNTKYGHIPIDNKMIKEILGYHRDQKDLDYIMKKNGLLDVMGYTETVKDFPVFWEMNEYGEAQFTLLSGVDELFQPEFKRGLSRKYTIKYPVKAFERIIELNDENTLETSGTFYEIDYTHMIPFEIFMYCMGNDKIGCTGFYLYSYMKMMNDRFTNGWSVSIERLIEYTKIPVATLTRYLDQLRKFNMINAIHNQEYFCISLPSNERKANTYIANEFEMFSDKPQQYEKMKMITTYEYFKMKEQEEKEIDNLLSGVETDITLDELPY